MTLVVLYSPAGDGAAHYTGTVTFNVSTTASDQPSVKMDCYQGSTRVYTHSAGFYPSYPWPQSQNFGLQSSMWTGGAASCTATMYYVNAKGQSQTITTLGVPVAA